MNGDPQDSQSSKATIRGETCDPLGSPEPQVTIYVRPQPAVWVRTGTHMGREVILGVLDATVRLDERQRLADVRDRDRDRVPDKWELFTVVN